MITTGAVVGFIAMNLISVGLGIKLIVDNKKKKLAEGKKGENKSIIDEIDKAKDEKYIMSRVFPGLSEEQIKIAQNENYIKFKNSQSKENVMNAFSQNMNDGYYYSQTQKKHEQYGKNQRAADHEEGTLKLK